MRKPGFIALGMKWPATHACAGGHADYCVSGCSPAIMNFCKVINNLIEPDRCEICKLHFHNRFITFQRKPQCGAYHSTFTKGCITYPFATEFLQKALRDLKCTPIFGNILTHQDQVVLRLHALP